MQRVMIIIYDNYLPRPISSLKMSQYDQFGLWLNNQLILQDLNEDELESNIKPISAIFGGFAQMIKICMDSEDCYKLKLQQHQQLFTFLNSIKEEQSQSE
eukprot:415745_1